MDLGQQAIGGVLRMPLARVSGRIPGSIGNIAIGMASDLIHPFVSG